MRDQHTYCYKETEVIVFRGSHLSANDIRGLIFFAGVPVEKCITPVDVPCG